MANTPSVSTLVHMLLMLVSLSAANSSSNNSKGSAHNVYNTYNSFCAGPSKKIEALLHDVKKELSEMREEIKSLRGNKTTGEGISELSYAPELPKPSSTSAKYRNLIKMCYF